MITCYLRYEVDPDKLADFEACGAMWLDLMPRFGGIHHGYFLPSEGESDVAWAMFSFPSLAAYEQYLCVPKTLSELMTRRNRLS
jgi:NIPSNAP